MHRIRISKRPIKWIPSQVSAIFARKGDREVEHQVENLPTKERQEMLRNLKKQKHKQAGFDWNDTAESMKVNSVWLYIMTGPSHRPVITYYSL